MTSPQNHFPPFFSPPPPTHKWGPPNGEDEDRHKNSTNPCISPRCEFTFSDGRQCTLPAKVSPPPRKGYQQDALFAVNEVEFLPVKEVQQAQFCVHHSSRKEREGRGNGVPDEGLVGPGLVALCGDLTTATNVNRALSQVFLLMAQGRIPQKQAVAFGYITQLLLQTIPGIRSEYVSVHGYDAWETNLKSKIITSPLSTPAAQPKPPPPPPPPTPPSPDYDNLLRRSRNLLDRKYDTTPEGRREANALALELELMNPAPAKPRRDFFSRTVALVRHLRDLRRERHGHQELRGVKEVQNSATAARPSPPPPPSFNKV